MVVSIDSSATSPTAQDVILDAARHLIGSQGYAGFSMRGLASRSGLAKGTIYYYFTDKQQIVLALLQREMAEMRRQIVMAAQIQGTPVERLRTVIPTFMQMAHVNSYVFISALRDIVGAEQTLKTLVVNHRSELLAPIIHLLEEGMAQGYFRPLDPERTAISLFGLMNSTVADRFLWMDEAELAAPLDNNLVNHIVSLFLNGICL